MDDPDIVQRIGLLADQERVLEHVQAGDRLRETDSRTLHDIGVALDQWWDLLRQRRARRLVGHEPDDTTATRPTDAPAK